MTSSDIEKAFHRVLEGQSYQVVQLENPWLRIFAQNYKSHAALLIRATIPEESSVADARGFSVETDRSGNDDYVRITSEEKGFPEIFKKMVELVCERTSTQTSLPAALDVLTETIAELKHFFGRRSGRLSHEEVQGIFAELLLLNILVHATSQPRIVVSSWRGPSAQEGLGLHDFTFPSGRGIEVKSSHQPATEIRVSSPEQLVVSGDQLDLLVLPVESKPLAGRDSRNIRQLVNECLSSLENDSESQIALLESLGKIGLDHEDEFYDSWNFVPGNWRRYRVIEGFPQIKSDQIPRGILKVTYSIALNTIDEYASDFEELISMGVE